jgi:hypothetical protein
LKSLLERFPILLVRGIFNGDSVVTLADFARLLPFFWHIFKLRGGGGARWIVDILDDVILQTTICMSATTPSKSVLGARGYNY